MFTPAPGTLLANHYRLVRKLGEGGMGEVWSAVDEVFRKDVAIKLLKVPAGTDAEQARVDRERLRREARTMRDVKHPGVVEVLNVVDGDGPAFLVMELLEGASLRKHLERGPLDLQTTCALMVQVASAVRAAHEKGIVHRDLKPENIFLVSAGAGESAVTPTVKVLDFGIAKVIPRAGGPPTTMLTRAGEVVGTPHYMSPEQVDEKDVDQRTDLWSFGIVLYECLSGKPPIDAPNTWRIFNKIVQPGMITPIEHILPETPERVARLLGRLLTREREKRLADMGDVIAVLERYTSAKEEPAVSVPSGLDSSAGHVISIRGPAEAPEPTQESEPPEEPGARRRPEAMAPARRVANRRTLALFVLVVTAGASVMVLNGRLGSEPRPVGVDGGASDSSVPDVAADVSPLELESDAGSAPEAGPPDAPEGGVEVPRPEPSPAPLKVYRVAPAPPGLADAGDGRGSGGAGHEDAGATPRGLDQTDGGNPGAPDAGIPAPDAAPTSKSRWGDEERDAYGPPGRRSK